MADTLISTAVEKLMSLAEQELRVVVGVTKEMEKLSSAFTAIRAGLNDAEDYQMKDESTRDWLAKLKDVAYDVDDLLDRWRTEVLRSQINRDKGVYIGNVKVPKCSLSPFLCFKQVGLRYNIGHKIKELHETLDMISAEKKFHWHKEHSNEKKELRKTSSLIDEKEIFGRKKDKEIIVSLLLGESSQPNERVPIISIIGMAGLGKTTLAQQVFNDENVKRHFNKRIWVCVSEDFNVETLTKQIIEDIQEKACEELQLNPLQKMLCQLLDGKQFLLVLDDVWEENHDECKKLKLPLEQGAQAPGSRVVITTRKVNVAIAMGSTAHQRHSLGVLPEKDCWSLFKHTAFADKTSEDYSKLEAVGKNIVKKCKGVPLAAKVIGGVMQLKKTQREWQCVLESEIWSLENRIRNGIYPALLLSYYNLPKELKQCFTYCSIFTKDCEIDRKILIKLWMAQGFIEKGQNDYLEEIGEGYFNDLLGHSLFQGVRRDYDGNVVTCKMHDSVHDLAQFITNGMEKIGGTLIKARHLGCHDRISFFTGLDGSNKLRTLLGFDYSDLKQVTFDKFSKLRCLRVLDLSNTCLEELPSSVDILNHLRYLDLSVTSIKELPNSVTSLCNMQTLRLNRCAELRKLPEGIGKLINLRHLEFEECKFNCFPGSIEKLSSLRTLPTFFIGNEQGECKIGALKDLNLLQGSLEITNLEKVAIEAEAKEARLGKKNNLHRLALQCNVRKELLGDREVKKEEAVFKCLRPSTKLTELVIYNYMGCKFPSWMEDSLFSDLITVKLESCSNCIQLPALGKLPSLKNLYIHGMKELKRVGGEFYGNGGIFPKLVKLSFNDMDNWEEWELRIDDREMPCLHYLDLSNYPKLKAPRLLPSAITKLFISRCGEGDWASCVPSLVEELSIVGNGDEMQLTQLPSLNYLKSFIIRDFPNLTSLPNGIGQLQKLESLELIGLSKLISLPEELEQLTSLQKLKIRDCPLLKEPCEREAGECSSQDLLGENEVKENKMAGI